jgi:hypothetical protein
MGKVERIAREAGPRDEGEDPWHHRIKRLLWRLIKLLALLAPHGLVKAGRSIIERARLNGAPRGQLGKRGL